MSDTAWAYFSVSTDKQAETLRDQVTWAEGAALRNGWEITRRFGDDESGVSSGRKGSRKTLLDLVEELRALPKRARPKRLLMTRLDRTGRGVGLEAMGTFAEIHALGVIVHTGEDGDHAIARASDVIKPFMRILVGALENDVRSTKWKAVHARRRAAGLHVGSIPFGVILDEAGRAIPYEPEAAIVRALYERAARGWGYARLARWARDRAPSKRTLDGSEKPMHWAPSTIVSLLHAKTIRGLVVDETLCDIVRGRRPADFRTREKKRWPWPLHGAIRCTCGRLLSGHSAGKEPNRTRYYFCRFHTLEPGQKTHPAHRADRLEQHFLAEMQRLTARPDLLHQPKGSKNDVDLASEERRLHAQLDKIDARKRRTWTLAEEGDMDGAQLRERLDEIDAERRRARKDLERVVNERAAAKSLERSVRSVREVIADLASWWPSADVETQREIACAVSAVVGGMYVDPKRKCEIVTGHDVAHGVAKMQIADAFRSIATSTAALAVVLERLRARPSI